MEQWDIRMTNLLLLSLVPVVLLCVDCVAAHNTYDGGKLARR